MPSNNSLSSPSALGGRSLSGFRRAVRRVATTLHIGTTKSPVKQSHSIDSKRRLPFSSHQACITSTNRCSNSDTTTTREDSVVSPDGTEHCPGYLIPESAACLDASTLGSYPTNGIQGSSSTPEYPQNSITTVAVVENRVATISDFPEPGSQVCSTLVLRENTDMEEGPPTAKSLLNGSTEPSPTGRRGHLSEHTAKSYDAIQIDCSAGDTEKLSEATTVAAPVESTAPGTEDQDPPLGPELALCRVYKKCSANGKITLYLTSRDLVVSSQSVSPLYGVIHLDPDEVRGKKVFAQISLTFRYGRDDEEVMGLKLSNESIICLETIYPPSQAQLARGNSEQSTEAKTTATTIPEQSVLLRRLGSDAYAFTLRLNRVAPPSVRLLPAKEYHGAAIGISYDLRVYVGEGPEERPSRRSQVRMIIRLVQYAPQNTMTETPPSLTTEKHYLLSEGKVRLHVQLDKPLYTLGEPVHVTVNVTYGVGLRSRTPRKLKVLAVQHVDVSMFSNGKFKNIIADQEVSEGLTNAQGNFQHTFTLQLDYSSTKQWVALEDRYGRLTPNLASTTLKATPDERNFFAIYVSYYVKVRLSVQGVGSDVMAKVPFLLMKLGPDLSAEVQDHTFALTSHEQHSQPTANDNYDSVILPGPTANDNEPVLTPAPIPDSGPAVEGDTHFHANGEPEIAQTLPSTHCNNESSANPSMETSTEDP